MLVPVLMIGAAMIQTPLDPLHLSRRQLHGVGPGSCVSPVKVGEHVDAARRKELSSPKVRFVRRGDMMTMDLVEDRATITLDRNDVVIAIQCT